MQQQFFNNQKMLFCYLEKSYKDLKISHPFITKPTAPPFLAPSHFQQNFSIPFITAIFEKSHPPAFVKGRCSGYGIIILYQVLLTQNLFKFLMKYLTPPSAILALSPVNFITSKETAKFYYYFVNFFNFGEKNTEANYRSV